MHKKLTCPKGSSSMHMSCICAQKSFYPKTKTFSARCFKSTWQGLRPPMLCTVTNFRLKSSSASVRISENQNPLQNKIKRDSDKLLTRIHKLTINLLYSSDYKATYSFVKLRILSNRQRVYEFIFRSYFRKMLLALLPVFWS